MAYTLVMNSPLLRILFAAWALWMVAPVPSGGQSAKRFTLVIDAGHGGHDAGAVGAISKEKDINLNIALAFGKLVEKNCPDVSVIYTRKTDKFIPLQERADIANRAKADLFISIHTNALPRGKIAYGAETYTLGMARAEENLEVAKRENAVILYEEDYKTRYSGFDPNSAESYIIFEFMQDQYMRQSVSLAQSIQKAYVGTAKRRDKGVHQAGFLVLRNTSMPSVLTEVGFISTPEEERFLNTKDGIAKMGRSIYEGFLAYKRSQEKASASATSSAPAGEKKKQSGDPSSQVADPQKADRVTQAKKSAQGSSTGSSNGVEYRVQLMASSRKLASSDPSFKGLSPIGSYEEDGLYKYTYGSTGDYDEALRLQREARKVVPGAFVIAFKDGRRVSVAEARGGTTKK